MNKAAFLDRDGVINRKAPKGEYNTRWEQVEFLPGVVEAIQLLRQAGYKVIVVTNQRCVAKGQISIPELEALHRRMLDHLEKAGGKVDAVYYCPHEKQACQCRKPAPGMLLDAARDHEIDLASSWMIGDSEIDIEAGQKAGCRTVRILEDDEKARIAADVAATSLLDAVKKILQREGNPAGAVANGIAVS